MADIHETKTAPRAQFFDELDDLKAGMLAVEGSGQHAQPMSHHIDKDTNTLWFITSADTDLVQAIKPGSQAHFTITGKDQDYWACASGPISVVQDAAKLDEIWSWVAGAWFEDGRDDPSIRLVKLDLQEAAVWSTSGNPITFGLEILKGKREGETADLGERSHFRFSTAA